MTEPSLAVPDQGLISRAIGVIVSPGATFRTVVAHPRPAGILFVVALVIGLSTGLPQMTARGRQAALDTQVQQTERVTGQPVTPDVYARMERFSAYGAYFAIGSTILVLPLFVLLFGAIYWAVFNTILGGTASFKQVLAIVTHSQVITALGAIISAPIQYFQDVRSIAGPFNLGALAPMLEPGSFVTNFLSGISFFTLWGIVITAIGLAVLYHRKATGIVVGLLAVYLALTAAFIAAFPSLMSR